jgi:hypothetical protein
MTADRNDIPGINRVRLLLKGHPECQLVKHSPWCFVPQAGFGVLVGEVLLTVDLAVWVSDLNSLAITFKSEEVRDKQELREVVDILTARGWVMAETDDKRGTNEQVHQEARKNAAKNGKKQG